MESTSQKIKAEDKFLGGKNPRTEKTGEKKSETTEFLRIRLASF